MQTCLLLLLLHLAERRPYLHALLMPWFEQLGAANRPQLNGECLRGKVGLRVSFRLVAWGWLRISFRMRELLDSLSPISVGGHPVSQCALQNLHGTLQYALACCLRCACLAITAYCCPYLLAYRKMMAVPFFFFSSLSWCSRVLSTCFCCVGTQLMRLYTQMCMWSNRMR